MDRIQLRRDSSARWAEINPILLEGEVGYEIDTKLRKIGDGVNRWNDLEYLKAEGISQEIGNSQNITMSQDAITRELSELGSEVDELEGTLKIGSGIWATAFVDSNGNIAVGLTKDGELYFNENFQQFIDKLAKVGYLNELRDKCDNILESIISGIVDKNGNAALFADKNGVHASNIISEDVFGRIAIVDKNGNAALLIDEKGRIHGNFASIDKINIVYGGKTYPAVNNNIDLPDSAFPYNTAGLMLPSVIPYVVGQRMDVYYESILKNGFVRDFRLYSKSKYEGLQDRSHLYYTEVGNKSVDIKLENSFGSIIESKVVKVSSVDTSKVGNFRICVIGDSKSENLTKQAELLKLCEIDGNLSVEFVGSSSERIGYDSDDNGRAIKNCAKSGSGLSDWCCRESVGGLNNPFYDSNVNSGIVVSQMTNVGTLNNAPIKFSIAKFVETIGDVDILWIDHGANQAANNETKKCYDYIIDDVKKYNAANGKNIKIVISVQEGMSLIPDYDTKIVDIRSKSNNAEWYLKNYDGRTSEGVFICPQYINVDLWNDFPSTLVPENSRSKVANKKICLDTVHMGVNTGTYNSETAYQVGNTCALGSGLERERNLFISLKANKGVEPNDDKEHWAKADENLNSGYYKVADMYYATLRYILSLI